MDLTKAVGAGYFPSIVAADTSGTVQDTDKSDDDFLHCNFSNQLPIKFQVLSFDEEVFNSLCGCFLFADSNLMHLGFLVPRQVVHTNVFGLKRNGSRS